jgi:hypothetical protein
MSTRRKPWLLVTNINAQHWHKLYSTVMRVQRAKGKWRDLIIRLVLQPWGAIIARPIPVGARGDLQWHPSDQVSDALAAWWQLRRYCNASRVEVCNDIH